MKNILFPLLNKSLLVCYKPFHGNYPLLLSLQFRCSRTIKVKSGGVCKLSSSINNCFYIKSAVSDIQSNN